MSRPSPTVTHKLFLTALKLAVLIGALAYFTLSIISTYAYTYVEVDSMLDDFSQGSLSVTGMVELTAPHTESVQLLPVGLAGDKWVTETNALPKKLIELAAIAHEGKVYVVGGLDQSYAPSDKIYTATIVPGAPLDNSLTPWVQQAHTIPNHPDAAPGALPGLYGAAVAVYPQSEDNAILYILGGVRDWAGVYYGATDEVHRATINNATGEVGNLIAATPLISCGGSCYGVAFHSAFVDGNRLYYVGGRDVGSATGSRYQETYSATIFSDGSLSQWTKLADLPEALDRGQTALYQGTAGDIVYHVGGQNDSDATYKVYYADIGADGGITKWYTTGVDAGKGGNLPSKLTEHGAVMVNNGMIYIAGGKVGALTPENISSTVRAAAVDPGSAFRLYDWCEQEQGTCNIGAWLGAPFLPVTVSNGSLVAWNLDMYYIGGATTDWKDTVFHGRISPGANARYSPEGSFTSRVMKPMEVTGQPLASEAVTLTHLSWQAEVYPSYQQTLTMQYRYGTDRNSPYPDGTWSGWNGTSPISQVLVGDLKIFTHTFSIPEVYYFQYKLDFGTAMSKSSPILDWVRLYYEVPSPDVQVDKVSDRSAGVWSGDVVTYTIHYTAAGGAPAEGIVITETLPDNVDIASTSIAPWNAAWKPAGGGVYTYYAEDTFGAKGTDNISDTTVSFSVKVTTARKVGVHVITNQVCIGFSPYMIDYLSNPVTDPITSNNCFTLGMPWYQIAWNIVKVATPTQGSSVRPDEVITYAICYTNTGSEIAESVFITDTVDSNLTNITPMDGGTVNGNVVTWNKSDVVTDTGYAVHFTATVKNPVDADELSNQARIQSTHGEPQVASLPITHHIEAAPAFHIVKVATPPAGHQLAAGQAITYTIYYSNTGNRSVSGAVISDVVNTNLLEGINPAGGTLLADGKTINWTVNVPATGQTDSRFFTATVKAVGAVQELSNTATIRFRQFVSDSAPIYHTVVTAPVAVLEIFKWSNLVGKAVAGGPISYFLTYTNTGAAPADQVVITDVVDTTWLENVTPYDGGTLAGNTIVWNVGQVPANDASTVSFSAGVKGATPAGTTLTNKASIDSSDTDLKWSNEVSHTVDVLPVLWITKTDGINQVTPGQPVTYTIQFANTGSVSATVILTDTLDQYLIYTGGGWNVVGEGVYTRQGFLGAFDSGAVTLQATVSPTASVSVGAVTNTVQIDSPEEIASVGRKISSDTDIIVEPGLWVTKTAPTLVFDPGDIVTYTITYSNSGQAVAEGVVITEVVDTSVVQYLPTGNWVQVSASTYSLTVGTLAAGQSGSVPFRVQVQEVEPATIFVNTLYIDGDKVDVVGPITTVNQVRGPDLTFTLEGIELSHDAPTTNDKVTIKVRVTTASDSTPLKDVSPAPLYTTVMSTPTGTETIYNVSVELYVKERTDPNIPTDEPAGPGDHLGGLCLDSACTGGGRYNDYFKAFASRTFNSTAGQTREVEFYHRFEKQATYDVYVRVDIYVEGYIGHGPDIGDYKEGLNEYNNIVKKLGIDVIWGDTYLPVLLK